MTNDNIHLNSTREREKAMKALAVAKSIDRKVVFIPRGISGEHLEKREQKNSQRTPKGIDRDDVLKLHNSGMSSMEIAKELNVSRQAVHYHLRNKDLEK